jgi:hypothetical protein
MTPSLLRPSAMIRVTITLSVATLWSRAVCAADVWQLRAAPTQLEDSLSAAARATGATGDAAIPACQRVAAGLALCVTRASAPSVVVMRNELVAAGTSAEAVVASAQDALEAAWAKEPAGTFQVDGVKGRYFVRSAHDGFDAAALLRPDLLASLAGGSVVVAVPEDGTLVWWVPGDADFDKMVAVGIRRMADASSSPVSPRIYRHDGETWTVWGEVRGRIDLPAPAVPEAGSSKSP